jgi:hypothetical protein
MNSPPPIKAVLFDEDTYVAFDVVLERVIKYSRGTQAEKWVDELLAHMRAGLVDITKVELPVPTVGTYPEATRRLGNRWDE